MNSITALAIFIMGMGVGSYLTAYMIWVLRFGEDKEKGLDQ